MTDLAEKLLEIATRLTAEITAANNTTGMSDGTVTAAINTLIAGFKGDIDTGTFRFDSTNSTGIGADGFSLRIPHNLGKTPHIVAFFPETDELNVGTYAAIFYLAVNFGGEENLQPDGTEGVFPATVTSLYGYSNNSATMRSSANGGTVDWYDDPEFFSIPKAGVYSGHQRYYPEGITYRWIVASGYTPELPSLTMMGNPFAQDDDVVEEGGDDDE